MSWKKNLKKKWSKIKKRAKPALLYAGKLEIGLEKEFADMSKVQIGSKTKSKKDPLNEFSDVIFGKK